MAAGKGVNNARLAPLVLGEQEEGLDGQAARGK